MQRYHFLLVEFEGHDEDPAFLIRYESHLTAKGWMYYNRALDDFFHGRMPRSRQVSEVWRIAVVNINQCKFASASLPHVSDLAF